MKLYLHSVYGNIGRCFIIWCLQFAIVEQNWLGIFTVYSSHYFKTLVRGVWNSRWWKCSSWSLNHTIYIILEIFKMKNKLWFEIRWKKGLLWIKTFLQPNLSWKRDQKNEKYGQIICPTKAHKKSSNLSQTSIGTWIYPFTTSLGHFLSLETVSVGIISENRERHVM